MARIEGFLILAVTAFHLAVAPWCVMKRDDFTEKDLKDIAAARNSAQLHSLFCVSNE